MSKLQVKIKERKIGAGKSNIYCITLRMLAHRRTPEREPSPG